MSSDWNVQKSNQLALVGPAVLTLKQHHESVDVANCNLNTYKSGTQST